MELPAFQLLVRCGSPAALQALGRGNPRCPAIQDIAMLFMCACLELNIPQPVFLPTPLGLFLLPTPPNASVLAVLDSSAPALRTFALNLAARAGHTFTIDLFASQANTITARFFSAWAEPLAEAQDALSQPDWSQSFCPQCDRLRPDFVFLYPPFEPVPEALRKAQCDQAQGVMVVPYAAQATWWPSILHASRRDQPRRLRPTRISCCPEYVENQSNPAGHYLTILHFDFGQGPSARPRSCLHGHLVSPLRSARPCFDAQDVDALSHARS